MAQLDPQTETAVASQALSELLIPAITDLDSETNASAKVVRTHFAATRDAMQRQFPWNFCEREKTLDPDPDATASFRFTYSYVLPPDCLAARSLHCVNRRDWKVVGRRILTCAGPQIKLVYTARVVEVPQWDALFRIAFVLALALACKQLCKDQKRIAQITDAADKALRAAWPVDAAEGTPDELPMADVIAARDSDSCEPWRDW